MAKLNREEIAYLNGMKRALDLVEAEGVELLRKEVEWRGARSMPIGITNVEITTLARKEIVPELHRLSTAIAYTLEYDLSLPSRLVSDFLVGYNKRIDVYRYDDETLKKDHLKLDKDYSLNNQVKKWYEQAKERGVQIDDE